MKKLNINEKKATLEIIETLVRTLESIESNCNDDIERWTTELNSEEENHDWYIASLKENIAECETKKKCIDKIAAALEKLI